MIIHLVDGTYELFRHFYGLRRFNDGVEQLGIRGYFRHKLSIVSSDPFRF